MLPARHPPLVSQNGEDYLLLTAFAGQHHGFFIDVGAFDGLHLSNTWALEQSGWRGYCVEPSPAMFARLVINRPSSLCLQAAAGSTSTRAELHVDPTMLLSSLTGPDVVRGAYDRASQLRQLEDRTFQTHTVDVITLDDVLRKHAPPPRLDLVSIDVEGAELDVLNGFDIEHHSPRVLVLEANAPEDRDAILDRCMVAGYELVRQLGNNYFFALEDDLKQRLSTTPVNCYLPQNIHPRGVRYTHPDQRHDRILLGGRSYGWDDLQAVARLSAADDDNREAGR